MFSRLIQARCSLMVQLTMFLTAFATMSPILICSAASNNYGIEGRQYFSCLQWDCAPGFHRLSAPDCHDGYTISSGDYRADDVDFQECSHDTCCSSTGQCAFLFCLKTMKCVSGYMEYSHVKWRAYSRTRLGSAAISHVRATMYAEERFCLEGVPGCP